NAAPFSSSSHNLSNRPVTAAAVSWAPPAWNSVGGAGAAQQTPNISSVIQEIVGRNGYNSNSSVAILITGTGRRTAESYNGSPGQAPELCVEYLAPPSMENRPFTRAVPGITERESGSTITPVKAGDSGLSGSLAIYPNPAKERVTVTFNSSFEGPLQVLARNANGRIVIREAWEAQKGENTFILDGLSLPTGVYFLQLHSANALATVKFVIQHR
ncbi:MAG: T9SS type A sorting domain-containing protein, partial [Phaeodactylibacter sp.]|nr:T9SS type A sorting domain-containing protein [Phaeodactylibacter sp.]